MAQLRKWGVILLACFAFVVALAYFITPTVDNPCCKTSEESFIAYTGPPIPQSSTEHIHEQHHSQSRSFKEVLLAFPWTEFEAVAAKNITTTIDILQYTKLFIDELKYFIELEPLVPINQNCQPPSLPSPTEIDCTLYPNAFTGKKRSEPVKIGTLLQFGFDVDVLEIHLNELYGVVDVFFIIESTRAHYGNIKKPLVWEHVQRQERFSKFPVVHFIIDDAESFQAADQKWSMETLQERLRWKKFLEWNNETKYFNDWDVIGFGDADEIPSRAKLHMFKYCEMKDKVDFGIWFPYGRINQTFRSDFPIKGYPYSLGDPTYYTLASAKASVTKKPNIYRNLPDFPSRKRGRSGNYILGGMHMTHYGYLPFQLVKYATATEYGIQTLMDVQKLSNYSKAGDIRVMEADFAATPTKYKLRIVKVDLSNSKMSEICVLPWFYDCNRDRYPVWEGGHDTRLDITSEHSDDV